MKGCLTAIAVVLVLVISGSVLVWTNRDAIITGVTDALDVPEHGKREYIEAAYGELLRAIDTAAVSNNSILSFGAAIESMALPGEVIYVAINKGEDTTTVVRKFDWNGSSTIVMSGYGAGTLSKGNDTRNIMIYKNEGPWDYMDNFVVYIEYTGEPQQAVPE